MSDTLTLARPYARAAFALGKGNNDLDAWSEQLAVSAAIAGNERIQTLLHDPRVDKQQLIDLHLSQNAPEDGTYAHFLAELVHFDRLALLPMIAEQFEALRRAEDDVLKVKVTSASELSQVQSETLKKALQQRFSQAIEIDINVDPELLGGVIIDAGGKVMDGSVKGRLNRLATTLVH